MAVTVTSKPSNVSFAGNPILVKAVTNLSNKTFLKICLRVNAQLVHNGITYSKGGIMNFSIPVSEADIAVTFNLSSAMLAIFSQIKPTYLYEDNASDRSSGHIRYSFKVWDEYLDNDNYIVSTENSSSVNSEMMEVIPGTYNDMQRLTKEEDTATMLGSAHVLSVKPDDGEITTKNHPVVIPIYSNSDKSEKVMINKQGSTQQTFNGYYVTHANETTWNSIDFSGFDPGTYNISFNNLSLRPVIVHVLPDQPFATYFQFINRLGGLESITCYSRRKFSSNIESERNALHADATFRPTARYCKHIKSEEQRITMSTGPISRIWAKWFVQEFFASEHCWMLDEYGKMEPVLIEVDDSVTLYDESEAELIDMEFEVVKAYNGYITGGHF